MSTFFVTQRSDGRGGIKPFGTYGKEQAGAKVSIGDRQLTVTSDGRVNIPKDIMEKYGTGESGKKSIGITFTSDGGKDGWKDVKGGVVTPKETGKTGQKVKFDRGDKPDVVVPSDSGESNWSPI